MLTENFKKSELSIVYVHSVAIKCGFEFAEIRIDNDSVDVMISANGSKLSDVSTVHSPKIDIQLKATVNWEIKNGAIAYHLKIKNYNDLIRKCVTPIFVLVIL